MKKLLSLILAFALIMSTVTTATVTTFAGTNDSEELTKAIAVVKEVLEIPENLSEFSYRYNEESEDEESEKLSTLFLNWSDPENSAYASACVSNEGNIISYYCYMPEFEANGLAKITKEQAKKIAEGYVEKLLPKTAGVFKFEDSSGSDYRKDYSFNYKMYVNDIACDFVNVSIAINKYAGKLSNYNCEADIKDLLIKDYPLKNQIISKEDARKTYISELGPNLKYLSYFDYSKENLKVFTTYKIDNSNRAIDANNGEVIKLFDEYVLYRNSLNKDEAKQELTEGAGEVKIEYTEEELKEIQKVQKLIDKNQADKIARKLVYAIGSQKLNSARLRENSGPSQEYNWYLNYEKSFVRINAKTGDLIEFHCYKEYNSKRDIGLEKAKNIVEAYFDRVCPDYKNQLTWTNETSIDNESSNYYFVYTRQVNGIDFADNLVSISVNKSNGDIVSYYKNWYEKATFPKLNGVMEKEEAFDIVDDLGDFDLIYKKNCEGKVVLVYDFSRRGTYMIDAYKGVRLDYRGEIYKEPIESIEYTDIAGIWAENIINELKDNGYYLEGDNFKPKEKTTQIEFFKYLYSPEQKYYTDDDEFYKMLLRNDIIKKEEISANSYLTRQEAAKFVTRFLGVDKLAKESSIFRNMYNDKIDKEYLGYASAVYALGVMKGNSKGRFNGNNPLTHSEAAVIIYNLLNVN